MAMTRKSRRLAMISGALATLAVAAGLVLFAMRDTIVFFYTPSDIEAKNVAPGTRLRLGGLVKEGSIVRSEGKAATFVVRDTAGEVKVSYNGLLPDLFREGQGVVTEGVLEARGQTPVARPFAALNSAHAADGVLIHVTGKAAKPISLIYVHQSETSDAILHHCVKLEPGAELTLLENGPAAARFSKVLEVEVGDGAQFHHIRIQGRDHERRAVTHVFARLGTKSEMRSFTLTANGRLTRNEAVVELAGAEGRAHLAGATVGDGEFHHDDTVFITHAAEACESRQVFKKVLMNGATGVFQGKILVKPGAQQTDGYQISQSLLLDEDSQFLAKPELEIYADDVKCSHGSTSGAIDETALFYLQSRGVPRRTAQALLVLAFLAEAIQEIADEAIAEDIRARLERWLARHGTKG